MSESEAFVWSGPGFYRTRRGDVIYVVEDALEEHYPLEGAGLVWGKCGCRSKGRVESLDLIGRRLVSWPPPDWSRFEGGEVQAEPDVKPKPEEFSRDARLIALTIAKVANLNGTMFDASCIVADVMNYIDQQDDEWNLLNQNEPEGGAT